MGHVKKIHHAERGRIIRHPVRTTRLAQATQATKDDPREWKGEDATYYSWVPENTPSRRPASDRDQKSTDKDKD